MNRPRPHKPVILQRMDGDNMFGLRRVIPDYDGQLSLFDDVMPECDAADTATNDDRSNATEWATR